MSASTIVATAVSQWRQGLINCITNKADPFNAITCCMCMIACLPPEHRPKKEEMTAIMPKRKEFMDDPDSHDYEEQAWKYIRELSIKAEEAGAKYISSIIAGYRT